MDLFKKPLRYITSLVIALTISTQSTGQEISFSSSGLTNENLNNPTSLDFGPDGRLYVAQQNGSIYAFTIIREGNIGEEGNYSVASEELIDIVKTNTPNHTDDGIETTIKLRQVTGILTAGTANNPVLYVTSSDNLIGGGGGINDKNLDTNSGVITKLTWNGSDWNKIDLVRGLPRCEENHSINGMDIFEKDGQTYMLVQQGGHSNKGAPSNNFVGTPEYLLSGSLLIVNLSQLEAMPVYTDPRSNTQYVYDLPTLNDPEREDITNQNPNFPYPSDHPLYQATIDIGDPFGGNDGLNQAFPEPNGPVQVFSPGYRNAYDVVIAENGNIYTSDNGPNTGWGGLPIIYTADGVLKGHQGTTTYSPAQGDYIKNEFNEAGSSGHGDPLHYVGSVDDANGTYYGGHPIPILAFPSRADLITYKNIDGDWLETARYTLAETLIGSSGYFNTSFTIDNFPDDGRLGNYLSNATNSSEVNILDIINSSTNGITEYRASNFDGALKGNILTASFNGNINRYALNETGDAVVFKETLFNGFGATPLDVIALPDEHPFSGTVWAATYGSNNITIFEPSDISCLTVEDPEFDPQADSDGDGYSNQDEIDNATNYCSGGSTPKDNDGDLISDLNDSDDDNDSLADTIDPFAIDPDNGTTKNLPVIHPFWNNDPGTGFFGLGFTGLMLDPSGNTDYLTQFDEDNISFGGAAGKASIDLVPQGDPIADNNTQQYAFQFGVNVDSNTPTFTIHSRLESPFFGIEGNSTSPVPYQSAGIFIGNGDQDNYLKVVLGHGTESDDNVDGVEVLIEANAEYASERFDIPDLLSGNAVDIYLNIFPSSNLAQPYISVNGGVNITALGNPLLLPGTFLDGDDGFGMAVGLIATSDGSEATPFSAIWDFINITADQPGVIETNAGEGALDFGQLPVNGDTAQLNLELKNLSGPGDEPLSITSFMIVGENAEQFSATLNVPVTLGAGGEIIIPLTFTPSDTIGELNATILITHSGDDSPLSIPLRAEIEDKYQPLLRINAGGDLVVATDNGPNWLSDLAPTTFSVNTGNTASFNLTFTDKNVSIPDYIDESTFNALFAEERWDPSSGSEMTYAIPLNNGNYDVNLYLGNGYDGTASVGARVYDIAIEGQTVIDNLDLVGQFGHASGGLLTFPVSLEDGELNITFIHEIENPLINAIEILAPGDTNLELSLAPIVDRTDNVNAIIDFAVIASGGSSSDNYTYSISGQPDGVQIEPTNGQVFGTIAQTALSGGVAHDGVHSVSITVSQEGFSSATQTFTWAVNTADLSWIDKDENENYIARHECSFVQAGTTFIMFGGRESAQQLDVYDYATDTWSEGGAAPAEFNHFQATTYQGLVWVLGAFQDNAYPNEEPASHIYIYNPASQNWIQGIEIPEDRRRGSAGLVMYNDQFYIVGGNTIGHNGGYVAWFDRYDPATGEWVALADAPHARDHFHATVADNKLYAIGGRLSGGPQGVFAPLIPEVDVYDFASNTWSTLTEDQNMPTPRAALGIATYNDKIFTMGGEGTEAGPAFDIVEIFDPKFGTWTSGPSMNHARHGTQAIVSGQGIYIAGGSPKRGGGNQLNMEVLGEDAPAGTALSAGNLSSEVDTLTFTYALADESVELELPLFNTGGNTAVYIESITISGQHFELGQIYEHQILPSQQSLPIQVVMTNTTVSSATGTLTAVYDNGKTLNITLAGSRTDIDTTLYRVNAGGISISDSPALWDADLASSPSAYVNSSTQNKTYNITSNNLVNTTGYSSALYLSHRFNQLNEPNNMQWQFPVENGSYQVNLLFAEVWSGAAEPGVRVFNVAIEDGIVLENFDITDSYGWMNAGVESFIIDVNDGILNIDLIKNVQNPQISGVEIMQINAQ